jgi:hypothetical protein
MADLVTHGSEGDVYTFRLQMTAAAQLRAQDVLDTARDIDVLLSELERVISPDGKAVASWHWSEPDPSLEFVASPNGASADTLSHVVSALQEGFAVAATATNETPVWPQEFSTLAQKRAQSVLERLARLQSIIVQATGQEPLIIQEANVGKVVHAQPPTHRIYSSIDGVLTVLNASKTRVIWAWLREYRTNLPVRCSFDRDTWHEKLGALWDHRVVVEGMVAFDEHRRPQSIVDVKRVTPRHHGRPLSELAGSAPDLTGGLSAEDFIALVRRND